MSSMFHNRPPPHGSLEYELSEPLRILHSSLSNLTEAMVNYGLSGKVEIRLSNEDMLNLGVPPSTGVVLNTECGSVLVAKAEREVSKTSVGG